MSTLAGRVTGWLLFLPGGIIALGLLDGIAVVVYQWAASTEVPITLWELVWIVFLVGGLGLPGLGLWAYGVIFVPHLACRVTPHPNVAAVMFGTVFGLIAALSLVMALVEGTSVGMVVYRCGFAGLVLIGVRGAHDEQPFGASS